jgi:glycosyltransferase involved in cell wall biosynthesis
MEKQSFELINGMKSYTIVHSIVYDGTESKLHFFLNLKTRIYNTCQQHPGITIIHYNDGAIAAWCARFTRFPHVHRTVTLHGLDVVFPNRIFQRILFQSLNRVHKIITVSEATKRAAIQRGALPQNVITIANGVDTSLAKNSLSIDQYEAFFQKQYGHSIQQKKILVAIGRPVRRKGLSWFIQEVLPQLNDEALLVLVGPFQRKEPTAYKILRCLPRAM